MLIDGIRQDFVGLRMPDNVEDVKHNRLDVLTADGAGQKVALFVHRSLTSPWQELHAEVQMSMRPSSAG